MDQDILAKLNQILGQDTLNQLTTSQAPDLVNKNEIICDCKTVILKPNGAKLIPLNDQTLAIDEELENYQKGDKIFKDIIRGCLWLVDDMYKFEQMAFTKEINEQNLSQATTTGTLTGLRYLACPECNLCPLGWFDPKTKESFVHLWTTKGT